jgi:hypothetical protein
LNNKQESGIASVEFETGECDQLCKILGYSEIELKRRKV